MELGQRLSRAGPVLLQTVRGRLNRRLLTWFLVLSLAPLFLTNAVGYSRSEDIIRRLIETDLATIAQAQARIIDDRIERLLLVLQAITSGNRFLSSGAIRAAGRDAGEMGTVASSAAMQEYLRDKLATLSAFDALYVLTPDRRIAASAGHANVLATRGPLSEAPSVVADMRELAPDSVPHFEFSVPLRTAEGEIVGYLGASASASGFRDLLQLPAELSGDVDSYLVDASGRPLVVSRPRRDIRYSRAVPSPLAMLPGGAHARYWTDEGRDVIGMVGAVPSRPFRFIAELRTAAAFGELQRLRYLSVGLEIAFVVLLVAVARLVARDIVAPLHRLVAASRRLEHGDLTARVAERELDELGELERAFNEMAAALSATTARVREMHQHEIERAAQLATVGELASGVAHEIRNPVVGISSGLDLVQRHIGRDPKLTPIMDEMARQLARIRQTVQDLLTFARPATPHPSLVSSNVLVERAIRLVRPSADSAGVQIEHSANTALPLLLVDEDLLHQALVNLLMNAIEATPPGGRVLVSTHQEGDECRLIIGDTGRGIPEKDLDHIFKPFFTTRHTGTGLGLSITRDIVERHGGHLTLDSEVGVGTTATIHLPLDSPVTALAMAERDVALP